MEKQTKYVDASLWSAASFCLEHKHRKNKNVHYDLWKKKKKLTWETYDKKKTIDVL